MTEDEARRRFAQARVARLATADAQGRPHLVPIVFTVDRDTLYSVVDDKPKRTARLRRLANVRANPAVTLLVDHYDEDWTRLWWVRADGLGRVLEPGDEEARDAVRRLARRYDHYREHLPAGPVLAVDVTAWSWWSASGS